MNTKVILNGTEKSLLLSLSDNELIPTNTEMYVDNTEAILILSTVLLLRLDNTKNIQQDDAKNKLRMDVCNYLEKCGYFNQQFSTDRQTEQLWTEDAWEILLETEDTPEQYV